MKKQTTTSMTSMLQISLANSPLVSLDLELAPFSSLYLNITGYWNNWCYALGYELWVQLHVKGLFFQAYESGKEAYEPANPMITLITPYFADFALKVC